MYKMITGILEAIGSLHAQLTRMTWEEFKDGCLMKREVVSLHERLLSYLGVDGINARDLMMCYAFAYFDVEDSLKPYALAVCRSFSVQEGVGDAIRAYAGAYLEWKAKDRLETLQKLCRMYWEYELIYQLNAAELSMDEERIVREHKESRQKECLELMERIDKLAYFKSYSPIVYDQRFSDDVLRLLRDAFWDHIRAAAFGTPADIAPLISAIKDMKHMATRIFPRRRGSAANSLLTDFNEVFDTDFIAQRFANNSLDLAFWTGRCGYMRDFLLEVDKPLYDSRTRDECATALSAGTLDGCITFFAYVMERLYDIMGDVESL